MAEAFGVVAGAASLAIILVDKAITLKKVLQKIKEAPVSIRRIERELQILADTLTVLDDVYRRESDPATSNLKKSIDDICRELLDKLNDLLSALKKRFERQQIWTWASIKVVLKQDEIKELSKRMSDVLQLLQIVNQMAFNLSQQRELNRVSSQLSQLLFLSQSETEEKQGVVAAMDIPCPPVKVQQISWNWAFWASYWILIGTFSNFQQDTAWRLSFHPARYIPLSSWQQTVKASNVVSSDSPLFRACGNRDVSAAQSLLRNGLASPFDVTPEGLTPLHLAAKQARAPICQLLVDYGTDGNEIDKEDWTPLMYLAWQAYRREQDALTVLKILVQQAQSDPMVPTSRIFSSKAFPFGFIPSALHGWQGSYEGYSWLLQQDHIFVDIDEIKGKYPAPWHIQVIVRPEKANLIFEALFDDKIAPEITETPDLLFWSVISCVCFAIDWVPERDIFPKFHSIYELVKRGCDVHGKKDSWMVHEKRTILYNLLACHKFYLVSTTPLSLPNQVSSHLAFDTELYLKLAADEYLATTGDGSSKQKTEREAIFQAIFRRQNTEERMRRNIIRAWFEILLSCGINLHDYARTEEKFYRKRTICTGSAPLGYFLDIQFSFQYGPTPEDLEISWQDIWFRDPSYTPVPGAWEDEDYEVHSTIRLLAEYCVSNQLKPTMDGPSGKYSLEKSSNVE